MRLSPPITVLCLMAALVAGTVWLAPSKRDASQVPVMLPAATYHKLVLLGEGRVGVDGKALTVVQLIEEFANK